MLPRHEFVRALQRRLGEAFERPPEIVSVEQLQRAETPCGRALEAAKVERDVYSRQRPAVATSKGRRSIDRALRTAVCVSTAS